MRQTFRSPDISSSVQRDPTQGPRQVDTARERHTRCTRRRGSIFDQPDWSGRVGVNCQHMGCRCQAAEGQEFCGDYCREHAADAAHEEHRCECGHDACTMAAV